ncbi:hypothetical protein BACCIP111895_02386 [Neobacillus rhizosphaerae]|uniref:NlpC/P60 domain-containing protein n=1 Tax=Neobacillus rhizosphaerae TaxID=2880965 RepID=A0ABM9ESV7_9BACI|nr:hypothetical protein BACCIP111895_02386 [Neobacillus rhizosphaerae]
MIKKMLALLSLIIMLAGVGNDFFIQKVNAKSLGVLQNEKDLNPIKLPTTQTIQISAEPKFPNHQGNIVSLNPSMKRLSTKTQEDNQEKLKINMSEVDKLEEDITVLNGKLAAQSNIEATTSIESEYISTVINAGNKYIGNSVYVFGGGRNAKDIAKGRFDCSAFVHWAFAQAGLEIGSNTDAIKKEGRQISPEEMQPGDLVFFDTYKKDGHVGIYIGNGKFIGSQSSTGVAIVEMTNSYWKNAFKGHVIRI